MAYYSPCTDESGNSLPLSELSYSHLSQLSEVEEGYRVEFKSQWNDSVKERHLAQSISSFANTEGGWLFIGVKNDGSLAPIGRERTDFSQQIGQIVKSKISPYPAFETKFIPCPEDEATGVLAVYVREGSEPPYICRGTVYIRIGSSKEPHLASHRVEIDNLINKRNRFRKQFDLFCTDDVLDEDHFPYGIVYLYNKYPSKALHVALGGAQAELQEIAKKHNFSSWMPSASSTLFYNVENVSLSSQTSIFELFFNYSMKLHIPLVTPPSELSESIAHKIRQKNAKLDVFDFTMIDGFLGYHNVLSLFKAAFTLLIEKGISLKDYIVKAELKNVSHSYLFFAAPSEEWINFVCKNNFRYCPKDNVSPWMLNTMELSKKELDDACSRYASQCLSFPFGYAIDEFLRFIEQNRILATNHFPNAGFSSREYYEKIFEATYD